jgi:hypothetical protein
MLCSFAWIQNLVACGARLCAGFIDHRFPNALRFENEFDDLPNGAVAGGRFRRIVRCFLDLRDRIAHRDREARTAHYRKIRKVIADIRYSGVGYSRFFQNFFVSGHFQRLLHVDEFHAHLMGAAQ